MNRFLDWLAESVVATFGLMVLTILIGWGVTLLIGDALGLPR